MVSEPPGLVTRADCFFGKGAERGGTGRAWAMLRLFYLNFWMRLFSNSAT